MVLMIILITNQTMRMLYRNYFIKLAMTCKKKKKREEPRSKPRGNVRSKHGTPKYVARNHRVNQIIGSANKGLMMRNKVSEE